MPDFLNFIKINILKCLNEKTGILVLFLVWLFSQVIAYFHFGVMKSVDSQYYINTAASIALGEFPQNREIFYLTYSSLIALLSLIGLEATWVVIPQVAISGMALYSIYRITQIISKNTLTPFVASLLYILWFKFQQWNLIVYTDTLFTNSAVISVYFLMIAKNKRNYLTAMVIIVFTIFIRPTGLGFFFAILSYLLYDKLLVNNKLVFKVLGLTLLLGFFLVVINEVLRDFVASFLQSYSVAEIIYPKIPLEIDKPDSLNIPNSQHQPLVQLLLFMVKNPYYMIKISLLKVILLLGHIKPYYSLIHNIMIGCFLYPVYFFAIKGVSSVSKSKLSVFILVFLGFQIITVSITSENWDGRFLFPLLPWIFILSSFGISNALQRRYS